MGFLAGLSFAPLYLWPFMALALVVLLCSLEGESSTRLSLFGLVWVWGTGYFVTSLYWISFSLSVDWGRFAWLLPLSALGLPCLLGFVQALPILVFFPLLRQGAVLRWLTFAWVWIGGECLRSFFLFGGFPWNPTAALWGASLPMLQSLSLWGPYVLGLITILALSSPYLLIKGKELSWRRRLWCLGILWNGMLGLCIWGMLRIQIPEFVTSPSLVLVQPNVPQKEKLMRNLQLQQFQDLCKQTWQAQNAEGTRYIFWPESPISGALHTSQLSQIRWPLRPGKVLTLGFFRHEKDQSYNSLAIVASSGQVQGTYDKVKLVPFGEYIPGRRFLSRFVRMDWLSALTLSARDTTPGVSGASLKIPGLPAAKPLICFESAFPGARGEAAWIINITNDAWFDGSAGIYQHFDQGRLRAIEQGIPFVQVANTGQSGVSDAYGQVTASLPLYTRQNLVFRLPKALPPTLYSRVGELFLVLSFSVFLLYVWGERIKACLSPLRSSKGRKKKKVAPSSKPKKAQSKPKGRNNRKRS
jgi:apolipoprotein N-acyltransferase